MGRRQLAELRGGQVDAGRAADLHDPARPPARQRRGLGRRCHTMLVDDDLDDAAGLLATLQGRADELRRPARQPRAEVAGAHRAERQRRAVHLVGDDRGLVVDPRLVGAEQGRGEAVEADDLDGVALRGEAGVERLGILVVDQPDEPPQRDARPGVVARVGPAGADGLLQGGELRVGKVFADGAAQLDDPAVDGRGVAECGGGAGRRRRRGRRPRRSR